MLKLLTKSIIIKWIISSFLFFMLIYLWLRSMRRIWLNKFSYFLLKLCFFLITSWMLTSLTCNITLLESVNTSRRNIFNMLNMMFIFLKYWQSQHLILKIILFVLIIVIYLWKWIFFSTFLLRQRLLMRQVMQLWH